MGMTHSAQLKTGGTRQAAHTRLLTSAVEERL